MARFRIAMPRRGRAGTRGYGADATPAAAVWDPFAVLWLPHDARLPDREVLRAYERRIGIMRLTVHDHKRWPEEVTRLTRAAWALRTPPQRREVLADLLVQPGMPRWLRSDPERAALHDALLSPLTGDLDE